MNVHTSRVWLNVPVTYIRDNGSRIVLREDVPECQADINCIAWNVDAVHQGLKRVGFFPSLKSVEIREHNDTLCQREYNNEP